MNERKAQELEGYKRTRMYILHNRWLLPSTRQNETGPLRDGTVV